MSEIETRAPVGALSVNELCRQYSIGRTFFYEELKAGRLVAHKAGAKTLVAVAEAERWFASLGTVHATKAAA